MIGNDHARALSELKVARRRRLSAMLVGYGDDSSDRNRSKVFAVGILVGTQDQWDEFKVQWDLRNNGIPFHAADCESGWGDYKKIAHQSRLDLYRELTHLINDSGLWGFCNAISLPAFKEVCPEEETVEFPYYLCFTGCVGMCAALGSICTPPQSIDITFDRNFERDPSSAALYEFLGKIKEWVPHSHLGEKVSFADHRKESGIQAADCVFRAMPISVPN